MRYSNVHKLNFDPKNSNFDPYLRKSSSYLLVLAVAERTSRSVVLPSAAMCLSYSTSEEARFRVSMLCSIISI